MSIETGEAAALRERAFLRRLRTWLVLGNLFIAALFLGLVVKWQAGILHSEQDDARRRMQGLSLSISQTIAGQMDQVDLGLKSVMLQWQAMDARPGQLPAGQVNAMLAQQLAIMPFLDSLMVTDAQGRVRYSDRADTPHAIDLSERAHFQQARAQRESALIISQAMVSHATQQQMLFAVRRLEHADGSFAGVVSGAINPARFHRIFGAVELGDKGIVSLRNAERQILARVLAGQSQDVGLGRAEISPELARAFDGQAASGSFVSTVRLDGIERISAFQRVGGYPFMVIVAEGTNTYLLPWRVQVERIALLCTLAVLGMAALSVVVCFSIQRETSGRRRLETALQRSQAWLQASPDGVLVREQDGTIVSANHALAALLGFHPDYLMGRSLSLLTALPLQALLPPQHDTPAAVHRLQTQFSRLDGSLLDVEVYVSTVPSSTGPLLYCAVRGISHFLSATRTQHEHTV